MNRKNQPARMKKTERTSFVPPVKSLAGNIHSPSVEEIFH